MPKTTFVPQAFSEEPYRDIPMAQVDSSQVSCIGHCPDTNTLAVQFKHGGGHIYHYPNVSAEQHLAFVKAESIGSHFGKHIKPLPFKKFPAPQGDGLQDAKVAKPVGHPLDAPYPMGLGDNPNRQLKSAY